MRLSFNRNCEMLRVWKRNQSVCISDDCEFICSECDQTGAKVCRPRILQLDFTVCVGTRKSSRIIVFIWIQPWYSRASRYPHIWLIERRFFWPTKACAKSISVYTRELVWVGLMFGPVLWRELLLQQAANFRLFAEPEPPGKRFKIGQSRCKMLRWYLFCNAGSLSWLHQK